MTSDAKIGLLLGLVFIFIIAFIINGLPNFHKNENNNELTTNRVLSHNKHPGIAANQRKIQEVFNQAQAKPIQYKLPELQSPPKVETSVRSTMPLPTTAPPTAAADKTLEVKTPAPAPPEPVVTNKNKSEKLTPTKPSPPKVYVVQEADTLALIAKKFYGSQEGNKIENIAEIFKANRKLLKSPDEIYVGLKLTIPPLSASTPQKDKTDSAFSAKISKKTKLTDQRYLASSSRRTKPSRWYVVREGDSLWKIADKQLGDGSRYREIARINADILDDEDELAVGMRLKMPAR